MGPPVVRLAVTYGAGLWAGLVFLLPWGVLLALLLASAAAVWRAGWWGALGAAWVMGLAAGSVRAGQQATTCRAVWETGRRAAIVVVHDAPGTRRTTTASVLHAREGCRGPIRLAAVDALPAGARAVVLGAYRGHGVLRVEHARALDGPRLRRFALRAAVQRRVRGLYGARAALVEALVLGRRDDIAPAWRNAFVAAGLAHLLAISGLHVGILAAWLTLLFRVCQLRRAAWLLSAGAAWAYAAFLGFPAPATRAAGFLAVYGVARLRQRRPARSAVLGVAALAVVAVDPGAATAVGAWLSVAAVWGTGQGMALVRGRRWWRPLARLAGASLGATLATAPITAWCFGSVSPAGLLANLVAVPLAGVAVPGVLASLALGGPVAAGAGIALAALEHVAAAAASLPGGHLVGVPGTAFAAPWALALALVAWRVGRPPRPQPRHAVAYVAGGLALVIAVVVGRPRPPSGGVTLHVLNVGQGDAIAIRTPNDRWLLVDAGPRGPAGDAGRRVVVPFLRRRGVRALDVLLVSHADADHLGGAPAVVEALHPRLVLEPGQPRGTALYLEYLAHVDASGATWQAARAGDVLQVDSVRLEVLHPRAGWMAQRFAPNESSVVVRVTYGCFEALLTGDVGLAAESALAASVGEADLLKVGHHGSAGGTGHAWLEAVRPKAAVISVGRNRYGHPAPAVMARLRSFKIPVFRTDGGTVTVRSDGRYLEVYQGDATTLGGIIQCRLLPLLRSKGSSSSRSGCTRAPRVSSPTCSTTSPSPPR